MSPPFCRRQDFTLRSLFLLIMLYLVASFHFFSRFFRLFFCACMWPPFCCCHPLQQPSLCFQVIVFFFRLKLSSPLNKHESLKTRKRAVEVDDNIRAATCTVRKHQENLTSTKDENMRLYLRACASFFIFFTVIRLERPLLTAIPVAYCL